MVADYTTTINSPEGNKQAGCTTLLSAETQVFQAFVSQYGLIAALFYGLSGDSRFLQMVKVGLEKAGNIFTKRGI